MNPFVRMTPQADNPGEAVFYDLAFFLQLGEPPSFPLAVHETYKENNPQ